jgi:hypothetical protein
MFEYLNLMLSDKDFFMSNINNLLGGVLICLMIIVMLWMLFKIGRED